MARDSAVAELSHAGSLTSWNQWHSTIADRLVRHNASGTVCCMHACFSYISAPCCNIVAIPATHSQPGLLPEAGSLMASPKPLHQQKESR